jgi:hypothetical protein
MDHWRVPAICSWKPLSLASGHLGSRRDGDRIELRRGTVRAEGNLDFPGTLGVSKEAPVGFQRSRLRFDLDAEASDEQIATLIRLTERYCVVYQTLRQPPDIKVSCGHTTQPE